MQPQAMIVLLLAACAGEGNVGNGGGATDADTDTDTDADADTDSDTDTDTDTEPPPLTASIEQDVLDLVFETDAATIALVYDTLVYQLTVVDGKARWPIPDICTVLDATEISLNVGLDAEPPLDLVLPLVGQVARPPGNLTKDLGPVTELTMLCVEDCADCYEAYEVGLDGTFAFRGSVAMGLEIYSDPPNYDQLEAQMPPVADLALDIGTFTGNGGEIYLLAVTPLAGDERYTWAVWPLP